MHCKKINANKRFFTFAKALADRGKKGWGSAVAVGYGGTSWFREKEPFLKKVFFPSPSPPFIFLKKAVEEFCQASFVYAGYPVEYALLVAASPVGPYPFGGFYELCIGGVEFIYFGVVFRVGPV